MALVASLAGTQSWASTGTKSITVSVSAGDVLALVVGAGDPATTVTNVTDNLGGTWTAGPSSPVSSGNMRGATFYKACSGSETSISFDIGTGTTGQALAVKVTGFTGTATLEGTPGEDESKLSTTGKTVTSGSCSNTTASAVAIALFAADRSDSVRDVSRSYSNSFTEVGFNSTSGSRAGAFAAALILSATGSQTTTFTTGDTGDEMYGAILVFGDVTSSGTTVSVPAGSLTLTGFAPTVVTTANQTVAVPAGALTLTGFSPTVTASDHKTVAVPAGSLTLTGFAPTVSVAPVGSSVTVNVPLGTLTLTGFAPTVAVTNNIAVAVPLGTLTLTGYEPTVVTTSNVSVSVPLGQLTLTGYAPMVLGSTVASKGSIFWNESDYKLNQRLRKLAIQQSYIEDDEEALAILLASIMRRD